MESQGLTVSAETFNRCMRICISSLDDASRVFQRAVAAGVANEASFASLLRVQVQQGELAQALATLERMRADSMRLRLRNVSPLLVGFCRADKSLDALRLWRRMQRCGVEFSQVDYGEMLIMLGRANAPRQLRDLIAELLSLFPVPDETTVEAIAEAVALLPAEALVPLVDASSDRAADTKTPSEEVLAESASMEEGKCSCCGAELKLLRITREQQASVREELLARSAPKNPQRQHRLVSFAQWLRRRPPFDYVLDGPNIAYAKQNFEGGKFCFEHLDAMVRHLQGQGKRVLLLLPNQYATGAEIPNHTSSSERLTKVSDADRALLADWEQQDILYRCPSGLYDDWFWMYASVAEGGAGGASLVVTNDAMRDHWNELLPQRDFARWRSSQIVGFDVHYGTESGIEGDGEPVLKGVEVAPLPLLSVEAQLVGGRWHVPIAASEPQQWICVPEIHDPRGRWREAMSE